MIGVAGVLGIELPVAVHELTLVAKHAQWLGADARNARHHHRPEVVAERRAVSGESREHQAVQDLDAQAREIMLRRVKVRWHPAAPTDAAAKRHTEQTPAQVIGPLMIDAGQSRLIATQFATHQRAAMGAAIFDDLQIAFAIASQDDRYRADIGGLEVTDCGHLDGETDEAPHRAAKDALLLAFEPGLFSEQAVGHGAAVGEARPVKFVGDCTHDALLITVSPAGCRCD